MILNIRRFLKKSATTAPPLNPTTAQKWGIAVIKPMSWIFTSCTSNVSQKSLSLCYEIWYCQNTYCWLEELSQENSNCDPFNQDRSNSFSQISFSPIFPPSVKMSNVFFFVNEILLWRKVFKFSQLKYFFSNKILYYKEISS